MWVVHFHATYSMAKTGLSLEGVKLMLMLEWPGRQHVLKHSGHLSGDTLEPEISTNELVALLATASQSKEDDQVGVTAVYQQIGT